MPSVLCQGFTIALKIESIINIFQACVPKLEVLVLVQYYVLVFGK